MNIEFERYELHPFTLDRRDFLFGVGGGIAVFFLVDGLDAQDRRRQGQGPQDIGAWLHIAENGAVSVFTGKVEVGQDIRTSLSQAVAEELRVPIASIEMIMGDTDRVPFDQGTFGSRTTPSMAPQLRRAAAAAREMLIDLAAERAKVDRATLRVAGGKVGEFTFGELTKGRKLVKEIGRVQTAVVEGKSVPKVNGADMATGKHRYASDVTRPGMLYGKVLRPPAHGSTPASVEIPPGVLAARDGDFVGVAAPNSLLAEKALASIKVEWKPGRSDSSKTLFEDLKKSGGPGRGRDTAGSMERGLAEADVKLEATYTIAYIAHAPLEPRAAVAEWEGEKLTVWTGTQRPFGVRQELARAFGIPENRVRVIVPDTGSGYGGKHTGDAAVEAARIARAAGKPVKVVWTREEEFQWAYFRPAGLIEVKSGAKKDGTLSAWEFHNYNSGASGIETPYGAPNQRVEFHQARSPMRQGSYRALASTANHFARESHMDELASALKIDPLELRLKNLRNDRIRAVLQAAVEKFKWGPGPFGLACGTEKGGYVATCAEVNGDKVVRAVTAFECGAVVNPEHLKSQIEGSVVMGLGGALFEKIEYESGRLTTAGFSSYRVPRFSDLPKLETVLVDRKDLPPAGAGESPIVAIAPAVANAIFAATGARLRSMPLRS